VASVNLEDERKQEASTQYPCAYSQREDMSVMCVGAVDRRYQKARFSSYGEAVGWGAPGMDLTVLKGGLVSRGDSSVPRITGTEIRSGASYATPHLTGIAAIVVSWELLNRDIEDYRTLKARLEENALSGVMKGWPSSKPDRLANTGVMRVDPQRDGPVSTHLPDPLSLRALD